MCKWINKLYYLMIWILSKNIRVDYKLYYMYIIWLWLFYDDLIQVLFKEEISLMKLNFRGWWSKNENVPLNSFFNKIQGKALMKMILINKGNNWL